MGCNAPIIGHPLGGGGDPGQIPLCVRTYRGVWTIILPCRWGKWGRFGFRKPCTPGKTGNFVKEIGQFQVVLHQKHKDCCTEECGLTFSSWKMAKCMSSGIVVYLIHFHRVIPYICCFRYNNGRQFTNIKLFLFPLQVYTLKFTVVWCCSIWSPPGKENFLTLIALCPLQGGGNQELRQDPVQSPLPCPGPPPPGDGRW